MGPPLPHAMSRAHAWMYIHAWVQSGVSWVERAGGECGHPVGVRVGELLQMQASIHRCGHLFIDAGIYS